MNKDQNSGAIKSASSAKARAHHTAATHFENRMERVLKEYSRGTMEGGLEQLASAISSLQSKHHWRSHLIDAAAFRMSIHGNIRANRSNAAIPSRDQNDKGAGLPSAASVRARSLQAFIRRKLSERQDARGNDQQIGRG